MAGREVKWEILKRNSAELREPIVWSIETFNNTKHYYLSLNRGDGGLFWETILIEGQNDAEIAEFESDFKGDIVEVSVSAAIPGLTEQARTYTPPAGSIVSVIGFNAEAPFDANATCKLIWKYNSAGEVVLWNTYGSSKMPYRPTINRNETDGTSRLAVACDNGTLGPLTMSAYIKLLVINNERDS